MDLLQGYQDSGEELIYLNFDEIHCEYDLASDFAYHLKGDKAVDVLSHSKAKIGFTLMPCVVSNGDSLPPLVVFIYTYAKLGTRTFPKEYEYLRAVKTPYFVRFSDSGFVK